MLMTYNEQNIKRDIFMLLEEKHKEMNFKKVVLNQEEFTQLWKKAKQDVFKDSALDNFSGFDISQLFLQLLTSFNIFVFLDTDTDDNDLNFVYSTISLMDMKEFVMSKKCKTITTIDTKRLQYGFGYINSLYDFRSNNDSRAIGHRFYQAISIYLLQALGLKIEEQKNKPKFQLEHKLFYIDSLENRFDIKAYCDDLLDDIENHKFNYKL